MVGDGNVTIGLLERTVECVTFNEESGALLCGIWRIRNGDSYFGVYSISVFETGKVIYHIRLVGGYHVDTLVEPEGSKFSFIGIKALCTAQLCNTKACFYKKPRPPSYGPSHVT